MDPVDFPRMITGLLDPGAYPSPVDQVVHIETHISHVFLAGEFAYKLKKPVNLGFLDYSTPELRRHFAKEEIRLNRRLAGDLYVGVIPVTGTADAPQIGGEGPVLEYAVSMHRFPQASLFNRCALTPDLIDRLAEQVAGFHGEIPAAPGDSVFGSPDAVLEPMLENLRQVRSGALEPGNVRRVELLESWTRERWKVLTPVIQARKAQGRVRECHGDMHRGNIALIDGAPLIFDAIEFNPNLRWIDTASELAFLVMDLEEAGEQALARRLLNRYLVTSGDYGAMELLDFYKVYRAMVRAKVLAIRLGQPNLEPDQEAQDRLACSRYLDLAESYTRARRPRLVIACGLSGSGKSRLARSLRESLPMIHLRSDVERKRLFGLQAQARTVTSLESGIYFPAASDWTYERLRRLADKILSCGYDVLVDATFLTRERREIFRQLAQARGAAFLILALTAPKKVLRQRVSERLAAGGDPSEASLEVLERQIASCEKLDRQEQSSAYRIDTTRTPGLPVILERIASLTAIPLEA